MCIAGSDGGSCHVGLVSSLHICTRSLITFASCFSLRHAVRCLWYCLGGTPIWYQAGICLFRDLESFLGVKVRLFFFADFSSATTGLGTCLPSCLFLPDGQRVVRNVFISFGLVIPSGCMQLMIVSVT